MYIGRGYLSIYLSIYLITNKDKNTLVIYITEHLYVYRERRSIYLSIYQSI